MSDDEARAAPRDETAAREVTDGIRALHERIDELHHLITQRLEAQGGHRDDWLRFRSVVERRQRSTLPAWRRQTQGEPRWPVALVTAVGIALQVAVPGQLVLVSPRWIMPTVQGALLVALVAANPRRIDRESKILRTLSLSLAAVLSFANGWSVVRLVIVLTQGTMAVKPEQLLVTGGAIWLTNVVAFALWYWEFDRGGPVARALNTDNRYPNFQFPQMVGPQEMVPPDWEPRFVDYLYLSFTNATAFSPTDVMPLDRWAKIAMTAQALVSIVTVALVVARAVNILPGG